MPEALSRHLSPVIEDDQSVTMGRFIVTVIGIDNYTQWPKLHNAVNDALGIEKLFTEKFGFLNPVPPLLNETATADAIMELVQDKLPSILEPNDNLILFFAGHGHTRISPVGTNQVETGYIIPVDARSQWSDYIKLGSLLEELGQLPARHILLILDACHSGFALGPSMMLYRSAVRYEADLAKRRSRKVITSARRDQPAIDNGPVPGHSLFTGTIIDGFHLGEADLDGNGLVTSYELGLFLQQQVGQVSNTKQTPDFGAFYLDDRGEMVIPLHQLSKEVVSNYATATFVGNRYYFEARTDLVVIPEREIALDLALVCSANDELIADADLDRQLEIGKFMQLLLIPTDVRSKLNTDTPLIVGVDATSARIHWELLAQSDLASEQVEGIGKENVHLQFWGLSRGLTRQLHTIHVAPEVPLPFQRHLRVLIIADPAEDASLPGAEEEGISVADLFDQFNLVYANSAARNRVEVVRLFGPREATRTTVLRHLMMRTYDLLHFAGHCVYNMQNPATSGWLFSNGEYLNAYELIRVDHSPAFVFSNACESGISSARSNERSVALAPSFAESFFARGVTNFVCTAWPVEDRAARDFALTLYAGLLGLTPNGEPGQAAFHSSTAFQATTPLPIYAAMQQARLAIAAPPSDARTWGAYQHYGNPYFRFFDPAGLGTKWQQRGSEVTASAVTINPPDEMDHQP